MEGKCSLADDLNPEGYCEKPTVEPSCSNQLKEVQQAMQVLPPYPKFAGH